MTIDTQLEVFQKGLVDLISKDELVEKLKRSAKTGKPLRIKYGVDPSRPDIHLGHTVPLNKLRELQELGHIVIFLIGDFTARVGDPSGKSETRKMLTADEVRANAQTYQDQVFRILDKAKTEVVYNASWLDKLTPADFLGLMSRYTVARILERDDFQKRFQSQTPISLIEFMYPLLQGYDSVVLKNDIEIGGTDQKFNLLVGRELQRDWGIEPQVVMTLPIIEGTDGVQKMSKSLGNAIDINAHPNDIFGKVMSIPDNLILRYWTYVTMSTPGKLRELETRMKSGENPRNLKAELALAIAGRFYGAEAARHAADEFDRMFRQKTVPDDIAEIAVSVGDYKFIDLVVEHKLCDSKGEARRLIQQGGCKVNTEKISDVNLTVKISGDLLVQCGKRKFARFKVK